MIIDYHVHTSLCGHADGKMEAYVESAIAAGAAEMGFSDHLFRYYLSPQLRKRVWDWGISEKKLARYFKEAAALKQSYDGRITIRIGLEIDYVEGAEHLVDQCAGQYPWDFFLGSVHCLPQLGVGHISDYQDADHVKVYEWYFSTLRAAIQSNLFQSIAHPDLVWRYFACPMEERPGLTRQISEVVSMSKKSNTALEINANGYRWSKARPPGEFNPFETLLSSIADKKTAITLGSDAHAPQLVGHHFTEIIAVLKRKRNSPGFNF